MLERQVITMPFAQGVDTKTDNKQVSAGRLLELENGVFTTLKAIRKRDGHVALGNHVTNTGSTISSGAALATYGNELLLGDGKKIYSYDQGPDGWTDKGAFVSTQVETSSVVRDTYSQSNQDGAVAPNGLRCFAWQDSSGPTTVRYSIIDSATRQTVIASALVSSDAIKPRVLVANGTFLIYYVEVSTGILKLATLLSTSPSSAPVQYNLTGVSLDADALNDTSPNYDACIIPYVGIGVAYNNRNASGETTVRLYGLSAPTTQLRPQQTIAYRSRAICVFPSVAAINPTLLGVTVAFSTDADTAPYTTDVRYALYSSQLSLVNDDLIYASLIDPGYCTLITGCATSTDSLGFNVYWANLGKTSRATIDSSFVVNVTLNWQRSATPFARAFLYRNSVFVPVVHESPLQTTYFILSGDNAVVAKALYQTAGIGPTQYLVSGVYATTDYVMPIPAAISQLDALTFQVPCLQQLLLSSTGLQTQTGVSYLTLSFDDPVHSFAHSELGGSLHFTGGFVQMYDGIDVVEHNFHLFPEGTSLSTSTIGGSIAEGTYSYAVCYEWVDNQNNVHRSFPEVVQTQAVFPSGTTTGSTTLIIPYLQFTDKQGTRPVQIIVYRTQANLSVLYRISSLMAPDYNVVNGASGYLSYTDTLNDSSLAGKPEMYTQPLVSFATGNAAIVPNMPAPPAKLIQLHRNRLWVVDSTNPLQLWYSKEVTIDAPVEFSDEFIKQIDPRGGDITALATVDDKLLVFKRTHIFFIVGQGPTATGESNDLSDAILITTDVGCIDPRSVIGTPIGIMFKSAKGIYIINRSLAVEYVGAPVEAYNNDTITSATLLNDKNQVRFTLNTGKTLVYDYFVQQWGTFTGQYAFDSIVWQGASTILRSNGQVLKETAGVWTDAGSSYALKATTSWLSFANLQGFQRVRRAQILGQWYSAHDLKVDVCVDFNDTVVQSVTVTPTTPSTFGGVSPYGSGVYGGTFQLYQWRIDLARQKTQAVKFTIQDLPTATAGEGMGLSSIAFEVAAKTGLNKVPAGQIFS